MKSAFQKLSPISDADISGYENALDYVFADEDIKNIAISGAYSSGKSSIIGTYESTNKGKLNLLHVSLAHFCAKQKKDKTTKNKGINNETIESKILNQILQQISYSRIPLTRFRVKGAIEEASVIKLSLLLSLLLFSIIYITKFKSWCNWVSSVNQAYLRNILLFSTEPLFRVVMAFIVVLFTSALIYLTVHAQVINRLIHKICFKDYEIEIGAETDDSFFDKYMDEVIYIFEKAGVDGIVFEDIDRFDDLAVFERLREINTLVNIRLQKDSKAKTLRFFYLIRDDIFIKNKDRTKFFDFVIPVIPVVDGSNSYNKIISYLKEAELDKLFDDDFLRLISLYIDDLRIAKNIVNELIIYMQNLDGIELKPNMMFAMLTYKNIFPKDYSDLQLNSGYVHAVFDAKKESLKRIKKAFDDEARECRIKIDKIKNEHLESLIELDGVKRDRSSFQRDYKVPYNSWVSNDYPRRKASIDARANGRVKELEERLSEIAHEKSKLEEYSLSELISNYPEYNAFDIVEEEIQYDSEGNSKKRYGDIIENQYYDLLKLLLSDGYIDETYSDYMTFFYPNSLSRNDKIFIRSIADRKAKDFGYHIENPSLVSKFLKQNHFKRVETLNFDLYDLVFSGVYPQHVDNAISLLMSGNHNIFIEFYIKTSDKADIFVLTLIDKWPGFYEYAVNELKEDIVEIISFIIVNNCDETTLNRINTIDISTNKGILTEFIESRPNFLSKECNRNAECKALSLLNVSFKEINYDSAIDGLFEYIYQNNLYEINFANICLMLKEKCGVNDVRQQFKSFYSFIRNNQDFQFCQYIKENLLDSMNVYLEVYPGEIEDDQESAIELINEVDHDLAVRYIERLKTIIESTVLIIDYSLLPVLLKRKIVLYSADNILYCFKQENDIYPELVDLINSNPTNVDYMSCKESDDDTSIMDFLDKVLILDAIEDSKYIQIVENIAGGPIELLEKPKIPEAKMNLLVERKLLDPSEKTFVNIRTYYPQLIENYITTYFNAYKNMSPSLWANEEIQFVLSLNEIAESDKIYILKKYNQAISLINKQYSLKVIETILENNYDENDLGWLCQNYSSLTYKNQVLILATNNIKKVIRSDFNCDFGLVIDVLKSTDIEFDNKMEIVKNNLEGIKKKDLFSILLAIDADDIALSLKGRKVKVKVNAKNEKILELLVTRDIIRPCSTTPSNKYYQRIEFSETYSS